MSGQVLRFDDSAHRAADELLPWYVNGTLLEHQAAMVERHLRECSRCRREFELMKQLDAFCAEEEPQPDPTPAYRRLRERMDRRRGLPGFVARLLERARLRLAVPAWARWAGVAGLAGAVALGGWMTTLVGESPAIYQTLGAGAPRAAGSIAVVFAAGVTPAEQQRIVQAAGAATVDGPTAAGAYVLAVSAARQDAALARLRAEPAVALAEPLTARPDR